MADQTTDRRGLAFIPALLDDYGLSDSVFRTYCHMARRAGTDGTFYESAPNCARHCGHDIKTTRAALKELLRLKLVTLVESKPGRTRAYRLSDVSDWLPSPYPKKGHTQKMGRAKKRIGTPPNERADHPTQKTVDKGSPLEGSPIKGNAPVLSPVERITKERELERVLARMKVISENYGGHQTWTVEDRTLHADLKERRDELKKLLGVRF